MQQISQVQSTQVSPFAWPQRDPEDSGQCGWNPSPSCRMKGWPPQQVSTPMCGKNRKNPAHEGLPETQSQKHKPDNAPDYQLQVAAIGVLVLFSFILLFHKLIRTE